MTYFIYMIECSNGSFYTGYTTDIERRYLEHLHGTDKCKYTRSFPPVRLAACWVINGELSEALKIERLIKSLNKGIKIELTKQPELLASYLHENNLDHILISNIQFTEQT